MSSRPNSDGHGSPAKRARLTELSAADSFIQSTPDRRPVADRLLTINLHVVRDGRATIKCLRDTVDPAAFPHEADPLRVRWGPFCDMFGVDHGGGDNVYFLRSADADADVDRLEITGEEC